MLKFSLEGSAAGADPINTPAGKPRKKTYNKKEIVSDNGSSCTIRITAKNYGNATVKVLFKKYPGICKNITVNVGSVSTPQSSYSSKYKWYSAYTRMYYKTYDEALDASKGVYKYVAEGDQTDSSDFYSSSFEYFSSYTRKYYMTYEAALAASGGSSSYVLYGDQNVKTSSYFTAECRYYSVVTGIYYSSLDKAINESYGNYTMVYEGDLDCSPTEGGAYQYLSPGTGLYFKSSDAAAYADYMYGGLY